MVNYFTSSPCPTTRTSWPPEFSKSIPAHAGIHLHASASPRKENFRAFLLHLRGFYPVPCLCSHSGPSLSHCFVSGLHCLQWPAPCPSHCVVSGPPLLLQWPVLCPPHPTALSVAPTAAQWPICSSHWSAVAIGIGRLPLNVPSALCFVPTGPQWPIGVGRLPLNEPSDLCLSARRHLFHDLALHFRIEKPVRTTTRWAFSQSKGLIIWAKIATEQPDLPFSKV